MALATLRRDEAKKWLGRLQSGNESVRAALTPRLLRLRPLVYVASFTWQLNPLLIPAAYVSQNTFVPIPRVSIGVRHCRYNDFVIFDDVDQKVRKPMKVLAL